MAAEEYDYVVVGGGSAGCTLAGRLSEREALSLALIEAGPMDLDPLFRVPARFWEQQKSSFDWDLQTEPEPALEGRRSYLPRGRVLGGTSSMNTMLYVRGSAADYDGWAAAGHDGWSFAEVLPLFLRSEDNARGEGPYHGVGGPLRVEDVPPPPLLEHWLAATGEAGHPFNDDFNGPVREGMGVYQATQRAGSRCSAASAFVHPNSERPNLRVLTCTQALRLLWQGDRVSGVEVEHCGERRVIACAREVILCAGAYLSPQLLMLSGVGPAEQLRALGIGVRVDNPAVGANLQDHPGCFLTYPAPTATSADRDAWIEAGGFARSRPELPEPDLQFHAAAGSFADEGVATGLAKALSFGPYVTRPRSRGWVRLRSSLPQAKPRILHNFLCDAEDWAVLREGVRMALQIAARGSLAAVLDARTARAAGWVPASDSDAAIDEYMARTAFSFYHPAGTCAMGSVVDSQLRVLGVEGVRVCDTSIMPTLIAGNTNAPAIMFGERLAGSLDDRSIDGQSRQRRGN